MLSKILKYLVPVLILVIAALYLRGIVLDKELERTKRIVKSCKQDLTICNETSKAKQVECVYKQKYKELEDELFKIDVSSNGSISF